MNEMSNPFKLFGRMFMAGFLIFGYFVVCVVQCAWYVSHHRKDQVGEAIGYLGRGVVNATADIFRS